jgi:outer membrane protein assembly factor BamB
MKSITILFVISIFFSSTIYSQSLAQWRGPDRSGVYHETGLLKKWPENGPPRLWATDLPGSGYSSPSILNGNIYITGMVDTMDALFVLDMKGNLLWKHAYGRVWEGSYQDTRCTPTVINDLVYVTSGMGEVVCIDARKKKELWRVDACRKFNCERGKWGIAESPLVVDNKVIFTPAGHETTVVALDRMTGETIWKSPTMKDVGAYVSPVCISIDGENQIIGVTGNYIIGVEAETGKILWHYDYGKLEPTGRRPVNNTNTPVYADNTIFVTSGYDHVGVSLKLTKDGSSVSFNWKSEALDPHHGGVVLVDGYLYGSNWLHNRMGNWVCIDWKTGKTMYEQEWENKGSIIAADGMLYCYEEKNGNLTLVRATPDGFQIEGSMKIDRGTGQYWAHPVIHNKVLYVRHGKALMAFDIGEK